MTLSSSVCPCLMNVWMRYGEVKAWFVLSFPHISVQRWSWKCSPWDSVPTLPNLLAKEVSCFVLMKLCLPFHFTDC